MTPGAVWADWPAPERVRAFTSTRTGGCSEGAWRSLNLGLRCGDDERHVRENRARLAGRLPAEPQWLRQVHGVAVVEHPGAAGEPQVPEADALVAFAPGLVCAVLTADCLPVAFCDRAGSRVGVAHAGWRGLAGGVLEATVRALDCAPAELLAWLGPAIGPCVYEVGPEVVGAFGDVADAATPGRTPQRWLLDLYGIARHKLRALGVGGVFGGGLCTFSDPTRFYSYRRDGETGRMATVVWME